MTILIYNDVILRDCETKSFSQSIQMDPSGTDLMFSRFKIRVASTLVATSYPYKSFGISPPETNEPASNAIQRAKIVHALLSEPRKDFWFIIPNAANSEREPESANTRDEAYLIATGSLEGGDMAYNPLFVYRESRNQEAQTVARAGVIDVDNGPKPLVVDVQQIVGGRALRVEFEIEIVRKLCVPEFTDTKPDEYLWGAIENANGNVLSNRWHIEESKDENWKTTRQISGELRVVHQSVWPHLLRALCVPNLLIGYKRVSQNFVDDPTGLTLRYTITDRQEHAAPPYPAVNWKGHHAESTTNNGSLFYGEVHARLTGPPGVNKTQLIGAAAKVAADRIRGLVPGFEDGRRTNFGTQILNASVVDVLDEPTIELRVQCQYTKDDGVKKSFGLRIGEMGKSLNSLINYAESPTGWQPNVNYIPGNAVSYDGDDYICVNDHTSDDFDTDKENGNWSTPAELGVELYDPRKWPVPLAYDSPTPAGVFACYLQHPCSVWHDMPGGILPESSGSPETDEENAARPGYGAAGYPDRPPLTIYNSPHVFDDDEDYLATVSQSTPAVEDFLKYPYSYVEIESRYRINNGWTQLPLATTETDAVETAKLIKLHGNVAQRVLTVTATRDGFMPMIPSMQEKLTDANGIKEVLEGIDIAMKAPSLGASANNQRYAVQAVYTYLLSRAPKASEKLRIGSVPFDRLKANDHWLDLATTVDPDSHLQIGGSSW